jgi:hypothetical protein
MRYDQLIFAVMYAKLYIMHLENTQVQIRVSVNKN